MKILMINPNSNENTDRILAEKVRKLALPDIDVDVVHIDEAPKLICTYADRAASAEGMKKLICSCAEKYDAFIIACHGDPNLDLVRELAGKPVVGIAECSMKFAAAMGNGYAVISPSENFISRKIAQAHKYYADDLLRTIKAPKGGSKEDLLAAAREAKQETGVDVIVLGCANYACLDGYLERELQMPVLDGVACALIVASGLAFYGKYKAVY